MMHVYEIRKLEKDGKITTIRMLTAEPKSAKKHSKNTQKQIREYTLYTKSAK